MAEPPWTSHRNWTPGSAAAAIRSHGLEAGEVSYLGEGFDFSVFAVAGEWAFKFPKRDDYARQLLVESRLLDALHPDCPIQIPRYEHVFETEAGDVVGGYRLIEGRPALEHAADFRLPSGSAALLAAFISHVHGFDAERARELGATVWHPEVCEAWRRHLLAELEEIVPALETELAHQARKAVADLDVVLPIESIQQTLCHGDLAADHILLDPETRHIAGVIDWSDAFVGDPAYDFGGILAWQGEVFADRVRALCTREYDRSLIVRARAYGLNWVVGTIRYGLATDRPRERQAGIECLRRLLGT